MTKCIIEPIERDSHDDWVLMIRVPEGGPIITVKIPSKEVFECEAPNHINGDSFGLNFVTQGHYR